MKLKHWVFVAIALVGAAFLAHNYMSHGGVSGIKQGIGLGNY